MVSTSIAHTTILDSLPTSSDSNDASLPSHSSISLLPFCIGFDGPANISTYFHPTPLLSTSVASTDEQPPKPLQQQAAFRGRLLVSTRVLVPEGYTGLVFSTLSPAPPPVVASASSTRAPPAKRVKVEEDKVAAAERRKAMAAGLRRSPRKRVIKKEVVKRFMLDSDEEEEEGDVGAEAGSASAVVVEETVTVALSATSSVTLIEDTAATPKEEATVGPSVKEVTPEPQAEPEPVEELDDLPLDRDERHLKPSATFESIDIWHPDYAGDLQDDPYARTITEWIGLSAKVSFRPSSQFLERCMKLCYVADACPRATDSCLLRVRVRCSAPRGS